jgi:hypothetical protein
MIIFPLASNQPTQIYPCVYLRSPQSLEYHKNSRYLILTLLFCSIVLSAFVRIKFMLGFSEHSSAWRNHQKQVRVLPGSNSNKQYSCMCRGVPLQPLQTESGEAAQNEETVYLLVVYQKTIAQEGDCG